MTKNGRFASLLVALLLPASAGEAADTSRVCAVASAEPPALPAAPPDLGPAPESWLQEGSRLYERGEVSAATALWQGAAERYAAAGDAPQEAEALVRLAQGWQALGHLDRAVASLERASLRAGPDGAARARVQAALGETYLALGALDNADAVLADALGGASGADGRLTATIRNTQGSVRSARGAHDDALSLYRKSADDAALAGDRPLSAAARANAAGAALDAGRRGDAIADAGRALAEARPLGHSDARARLLVNLGSTYERLAADERLASKGDDDAAGKHALVAAEVLLAAGESAEEIGASRTASYAWGSLARLYERDGRLDEALGLTRRAILAAERADAPEALYRWYWQHGRLLRAQRRNDAAIDAYRAAARTLASLRGQRSVAGSDEGFEATVRPVYFELVDLLLERAGRTEDRAAYQALVREARDTVEGLEAAELRDYFRDECLAQQGGQAPDSIPGTVVLYPIALEDRIELIVSSPSGLQSVVVPVGAEELTRTVRSFRRFLQRLSTRQYLEQAEQLYDWLVRPVEERLGGQPFETLVFVHGGALRTIPPAALRDRETGQFLVEKYPLAVTPGLTLTDPRAIRPQHVRLLLAGLTKSVQGYPALDGVAAELAGVSGAFGEVGEALVDESFLRGRFEDAMSREAFGVVHIASHGEFAGEAADSFVLTYDDRLSIDRLSELAALTRYREESLELLTLSACQTAAGDDRAALGLAGVAVRSGARSALASLWYISDEAAAQLVTEFYRELVKPGVTRAEALRRAQVGFIEERAFRHPGYWAPFVLIGSWL